jgi:Acyl-protein synthetase, LuxE
MTIFDQVIAYIRQPERGSFDDLALEVFAYQFEAVSAYRRFCSARGVSPTTVKTVDEIPALSTVAFKHVDLGSAPAQRIFLSSGTTSGADRRSRQPVPRLDVYRASAMRHFGQMLFPDAHRIRMLVLHPTAVDMPESSLAQMISWCVEDFGKPGSLCAATRERVSAARALDFLHEAEHANQPVCILGTTAALAEIFESLASGGSAIHLAPGSRVMDTGGPKGQRTPLTRPEVIEGANRWLGIDARMVINEYGMTEMCSQLYDLTAFNATSAGALSAIECAERRAMRAKAAPPWLQAKAVDPVSLKSLPCGKVGLLAFLDLANVGSVSAIVTEDLGIVDDDAIFVLGRATGDARGCALSIAEFSAREA